MSENAKEITIHLTLGGDADEKDVDEATTQLLQNLRYTDVLSPRKAKSGETVEGTKSIDPELVGVIITAVVSGTVPSLIQSLNDWLERRKRDEITIKIQRGNDGIELTYNPQQFSDDEIIAKVSKMQRLIEE